MTVVFNHCVSPQLATPEWMTVGGTVESIGSIGSTWLWFKADGDATRPYLQYFNYMGEPALAGKTISVSFRLSKVADENLAVFIEYFNEYDYVGGDYSTYISDGEDVPVSITNLSVPQNANSVSVVVISEDSSATSFMITDVMINEGSEAIPFFSGDTPNDSDFAYEWEGIRQRSRSVRRVAGEHGAQTGLNLITNPAGRITDGTVTVARNLITNPRGRTVSGTVTVRESFVPRFEVWNSVAGMETTVLSASHVHLDGSANQTSDGARFEMNSASHGIPGVPGLTSIEHYAEVRSTTPAPGGGEARIGLSVWYGATAEPHEVAFSTDGEWYRVVTSRVTDYVEGDTTRVSFNVGGTHFSPDVEIRNVQVGFNGIDPGTYFDGDSWDGTPDYLPEWVGDTSRLIAWSPVDWSASDNATVFFSEDQDSLALRINSLDGTAQARFTVPDLIGLPEGSLVTEMWADIETFSFASFIEGQDESYRTSTNYYQIIHNSGPITSNEVIVQVNPAGLSVGDVVYFRSRVIDQGHTRFYWWDPTSTINDPDLTAEWDGEPHNSTSRLIAPAPVGWSTSAGAVVYYSQTRDAVAVHILSDDGWATLTGTPNPGSSSGPATYLTEVVDSTVEATLSIGAQGTSPTASYGVLIPEDGGVLRWVRENGLNSGSNIRPLRFPNATAAANVIGETFYIRALATEGEYVGPYFDGSIERDHLYENIWLGEPDQSTSQRRLYRRPWTPVPHETALEIRDAETDEERRKVLTGARDESWHYVLLNFNNAPIGALDGVESASTDATTARTIRSGGSLTCRLTEVDWTQVYVQPWYTAVVGDLRMTWPVGVFVPAAPKTEYSDEGPSQSVELYDLLLLLDEDAVENTYYVDAGVVVSEAVKQVLDGGGITRYIVEDSNRTTSSPSVWEAGTSRLRIINDLLESLNYFSLWVDGHGVFRAESYTEPLNRDLVWDFRDEEDSIYSPDWSLDEDMYSVPNRVVLVSRTDGEEPALSSTASNENPDSPFSYQRRGRWITHVETDVEVVDQATLDQLAARRLLELSQVTKTYEIETALMPIELNALIRFTHSKTGIADAPAVIQNYSINTDTGALMKITVRQVVEV